MKSLITIHQINYTIEEAFIITGENIWSQNDYIFRSTEKTPTPIQVLLSCFSVLRSTEP